MKDSMSLLSGVLASYQTMPLSMLHQLKSVLEIEIKERLALFGVEYGAENSDKRKETVGDVEGKQTGFNGVNVQQNNVIIGKFKRGDE